MNGNRNRYTSAPLYGMKNKKVQQADMTGGGGSPGGGPSGGPPRYPGLIPVVALLLPCLFILSMAVPGDSARNILKILFLAAALITLLFMLGKRAFGKNARYSVSLVILALMVICGVSLAVTLPRNSPRTAASNASSNAYFGGDNALNSVSAADIGASVEEAPTGGQGDAAAGAAQMQLMAFMNFWGEFDLDQMITLLMPSWVNDKENPKGDLFLILANRMPLSYSIDSISGSAEDDSRTITITCLIRKQNISDPEYYKLQVLMIRLNNNWYVDPNSLGGTKVQTTDVPGGAAAVTAVPTAIPTPTPPITGETVVYYNPQGGLYYHSADHCPKVGPQYEPLTPLYYRDLNSDKFKHLNPCPDCGAPPRSSIVSE